MRDRLRSVISTRAARLGSLHEMTKLAPTAILAEVLGYNPQTIDRHARASASTYAQYVAILDSNVASSSDRPVGLIALAEGRFEVRRQFA